MKVHLKPTSPRYADWLTVFGAAPVPIIAVATKIDGEDCVAVDTRRLTVAQIGRLTTHISRRTKQPITVISAELLTRRTVLVKISEAELLQETESLF